ncbi:MAG: Gfo/Idh/MocA family oxidoreductase [Candidatus Berkelbacteria bacterium]|nr:MAG: Gfo/Idh/MocA family oxidoreductase [Candidatus Berkelbacteria bacterium]QQG51683.1 MAG: Gfo/Idh/MocA family oxidoreductase [Candidatus Berkelbacteria bacterium]
MKIAVIGSGKWGINIVRTLHNMGNLGAVVETDPERRVTLATEYPGIPVYESHLAVAPEITAVAIATPAQSHYELASDLLRLGKDVFVEKPITLCLGEAQCLVETAQGLDRVLMVGHLLLYKGAINYIAEAIRRGEIGTLYSIHLERLGLGIVRSHENCLWSLGVHDVASLLHLVGQDPVKVTGHGQAALQAGVEDDYYVSFEFPDNVRAHLHCSWLWPVKQRGLTVVGSAGSLVYNEYDETVTLHRSRIGEDLKAINVDPEVVYTKPEGEEPLRNEMEHFIACVRDRTVPRSNGEQGLTVVKVLEAAKEAQS